LFDESLSEVRRDFADGTLDQSGRFYSDEELEAHRAALAADKTAQKSKASAA
jgi:hypothetical protein